MSYNGSGTFNINTTGQPVVAGTVISSSAFNSLTNDLATGLTTAITKDGQTTTTARITFAQGFTSSLVTDSSSVSTGSIITAGGVGIAKNLYVGGLLDVAGATTFTNPVINNIKMGYTTTATAAGTTTLTVSSNYRQFFTGSTTQTIVLPVTSTLVTGIAYEIENNSTGLLTVNSSGGNLVGTIPAGVCAHAVCIGTTLTTAADWDWDYISTTTITGTGANVLGTSPTITTATLASANITTALTLTGASGTSGQLLTSAGSGSAPTWTTVSADTIGFKNRIINGGMDIAQRGTSFTSSANNDDAYVLDRFYILSDGNDAIDVTQATTVPTGAKFSIGLDVETANKKFGIAQIIENANCFDAIGGNVTLSFQAKVSSTTKLDNVKCAIVSWSGTADTVTSDIISAWGAEGTNPTLIANATYENTPANLNVTTSFATYSVTANVDTASTANIIVFIWSDVTDTTAGDFLYITNVQLEKGSTATSFDYRPIGTELALCQRYYQISSTGYTGVANSTTGFSIVLQYPPMRAAPSFSATAALRISDVYSATYTQSSVNISVGFGFADSSYLNTGNFTGLTAGRFSVAANNGSGVLTLSAEL